ncbi:26 kDa periplasmic immunogenic protein [Ketogulonicigenium robustum]|uniref:26 kDa periplasmic immunogenic protein n=1 Tax=Ketogulonicigenium robustum TaxID=92947 RepID=A0A1W6NY00_9RHOB|nr:SIMPL domain-containing protein [Ketogulonicigenium robustum]ARO13970.1 26 kDa periplasmic immunogenic protein [Ketogulonicigenium robustum]
MKHSITTLAAVTAVALMAAPAFADDRTMTVTGNGTVTLSPDMARVSVGVSADADTAAEAMSSMSADLAAVMAKIEAAGIEARDVQTSAINLSPRYDYPEQGGPVMVGYNASSSLQLRVRALDTLGSVLDSVVADGANQVTGVSFDVQDSSAAVDEARRNAVADAVARATLYADAAGVTLGTLQTLNEYGNTPRPMPMPEARMMAMAADAVPVAAGELSISVSVTMVYEIEN